VCRGTLVLKQTDKTRELRPARPLVVPRLLRRTEAAAYLNLSPAQFDLLRNRGEFSPVPVPSDRNPSGVSRVPVFDVRDLDAAIERWKVS
jgi:hypothetical protein